MKKKLETINGKSTTNLKSKVEQYYLNKSGKKLQYKPTEKIPVIQVSNFPELGKLTAFRFIEWVIENPNGVVSLPTGKTPEYFIKWLDKIINEWETKFIQNIISEYGIECKEKPELSNLKFVQIDEFYPINSFQQNSFYYYVNKFYLQKLGIKKENSLLINVNDILTPNNLSLEEIFSDGFVDLSLRTRFPNNYKEELQKETIYNVDKFCNKYEETIREMGGIGFFLGGIGPDGHIGFNVKGSDHFSTTRLTETNYETQASAATDLGGIEVARKRHVITIGLNTITYNKDCVAIIIASGEGKADIVRDSIQNEPSILFPATALQKLKESRFYLTNGAAFRLDERRYEDYTKCVELNKHQKNRIFFNAVVKYNCKLEKLTELNVKDKFLDLLKKGSIDEFDKSVENLRKEVELNIKQGIKEIDNTRFLHTAPHHDDIMLGYLNYLNHLVRKKSNKHHFSYFTSGFNAVTNNYMKEILNRLLKYIDSGKFDSLLRNKYFDEDVNMQNADVSCYLEGIASDNAELKSEALARRILRNLIIVYEENNINYLQERIKELINYFNTQYPGKKDISIVQQLKGMLREFEVEILWGHYGFRVEDITHLRLGFYKGDLFTEHPSKERDVLPTLKLINKIKPDVVTVALDPESSGPDTHYKVMQCIYEALKLYLQNNKKKNIEVWGYRNVWSKFHPAEVNLYVPASINSFSILEKTFMESFGSQKNASFPSWQYDGPFHKVAQNVLFNNYKILKTALGEEFFINNDNPRIRNAKGFLFLRKMNFKEFESYCLEMKEKTENI